MKNAATRIVEKFGSQARLAGLLTEAGHPIGQTGISVWCQTGIIPARRQKQLLEIAPSAGVVLRPEDFFEACEAA